MFLAIDGMKVPKPMRIELYTDTPPPGTWGGQRPLHLVPLGSSLWPVDVKQAIVKIYKAHGLPDLSPEQKVFVTIIKKTFFQPGAGRKEEALLRGLDSAPLKRSSEKILKLLCREGILTTARGKEGLLYVPQRTHTRRMAEILKELTLSQDTLWKQLRTTD